MRTLFSIGLFVTIVFTLVLSANSSKKCGKSKFFVSELESSMPLSPSEGTQAPGGPVDEPHVNANDCQLPVEDSELDPDHLLYSIPSSWDQLRPWSTSPAPGSHNKSGSSTAHAPSDGRQSGCASGWALDPSMAFGCMKGGWCPYACKAPYIEAQYDNGIGQPWHWQSFCESKFHYVGAGRRTTSCKTEEEESSDCAGGQNGLYCDVDSKLQVRAPSTALHGKKLCVPSAEGVDVVNLTPWKVTACRTIFPGSEIPQIPSDFLPNQTTQLVVPPGRINGTHPGWWTAGTATSRGLQHYLSMVEMDNKPCLSPVCQWTRIRPASDTLSIGGIDYSPYIIEISPSDILNSYSVGIQINTDISLGKSNFEMHAAYDGSMGNPWYGVRLFDSNGARACTAYWSGVPARSDCNRVCEGETCANKPCEEPNCAQMPPKLCGSTCLNKDWVQPHVIPADGKEVDVATALRTHWPCSVPYNLDNPGPHKIRIELFSVLGDAPTE